jgi:hypothetical protein
MSRVPLLVSLGQEVQHGRIEGAKGPSYFVHQCVDFEFGQARHTRGQPPLDGQDRQGPRSWPLLFHSGRSRALSRIPRSNVAVSNQDVSVE